MEITVVGDSDLRVIVEADDPYDLHLVIEDRARLESIKIIQSEIDDLMDALEEARLALHKANTDTGMVCALCGGPIREKPTASYCPSRFDPLKPP